MAAQSSDSSEKTPTKRRKRVTKKSSPSKEEGAVTDEKQDVEDQDDEPRPTPRRRKRTRSASTESSESEVFGDGIESSSDSGKGEASSTPRRKRSRSRSSDSRDPERGASQDADENWESDMNTSRSESENFLEEVPRSEGSGEESTNSDSEQPRRRRRRRRGRRVRGEGGNNGPGGHGGRNQGRGGNQDRDSNRGRRSRRGRQPSAVNNEVTGTIDGILELHPKGYGFLRDPEKNYAAQDSDSFVSSSLIEKYNLREGIMIRGDVGPGSKGQGPRLKTIEKIDGRTVEEYMEIKTFDDLTPVSPFEQIRLERGTRPVTMRVMDLLTPVGKGQRALIVAPPRTGKTMLLQDIADSVSANHPELHLIVLLIDERPEEVTEMRRRVKGDVIASSMDRDVESHVRISQLIIERGKRIAEAGGEVFILLDSITRTARAFNKWVGNTGRTMSGGLDVKALDIPKKMFGTARRFDEGGSLTVVATALIDTGSRMDEVIFQEFKGTGNMELVLSRELADRRIWPSIDVKLSGTRREELILDPDTLDGATLLRRSLVSLNSVEAMDELVRKLEQFPDNGTFLERVRNVL